MLGDPAVTDRAEFLGAHWTSQGGRPHDEAGNSKSGDTGKDHENHRRY
jgi:hypothetical protein